MKKKLKIAITGGIGSGKSIISKLINELGYTVLKADDIAKDLMRTNEFIKGKIIRAFGKDAYSGNVLNIKYLADNVFTQMESVQKINSIIHPPTIIKIEELSKKYFLKHNIVFVESALVYEAKIDKLYDFIILVYSDEKTRIERVMQRDKVTELEVKRRMEYQIPDEIKKERADFVIENNSSVEDLKLRIAFIINLLESLVK